MKVDHSIILKKVKKEQRFGRSCLFGCPDLNVEVLKKLDDNLMFLGQINLEEFRKVDNPLILPNKGILSIFLDYTTYQPTLIYQESPDYIEDYSCRVDFNEELNLNFKASQEFLITFVNKKNKHKTNFFIRNDDYHFLKEGEMVLFKYHHGDTYFLKKDRINIYIIIKIQDLSNRNFSDVRSEIVRER